MSRNTGLTLLAALMAITLSAACAQQPAAPRQATGSSVRRDGDPPPDTTKRCNGGLIGSGTYTC